MKVKVRSGAQIDSDIRATGNSSKKICMLAYTQYESDNRVRRYAEALAQRGDKVDVIALGHREFPPGSSVVNGVTVYRIQCREGSERSKWTYLWRLLKFALHSSALLGWRHRRVQYDLIHVHNVPDFLVFGAWYPKLTGAKLILDIHDIVPEFFESKFRAQADSLYVRVLKRIEKASSGFADHVIVSNHLWFEKLISRSVSKKRCSVFLNHVDPAVFFPHTRTRYDGKIIILFPGSFQSHQGLDIAINAFSFLAKRIPNAELHFYGIGAEEMALRNLVHRLNLGSKVKFCGLVGVEQIANVVANADIGIVPKLANSFGNEAYSTKIMEFMSQGVPVVVSRTKIDSIYFNESLVHFFPSGDVRAMARAIEDVLENKALREALIRNGYEYAIRNNWNSKKFEYLALVDWLITGAASDFVANELRQSGLKGLMSGTSRPTDVVPDTVSSSR